MSLPRYREHDSVKHPLEDNLHHLMFNTFVEYFAGRGYIHQSKPIVDGKLVTPVGNSILWGYTQSWILDGSHNCWSTSTGSKNIGY